MEKETLMPLYERKIEISSEWELPEADNLFAFIESYMPDADGTYVKVYFYLIQCVHFGGCISFSEIADRLSCTESDVRQGVAYWNRKGVLRTICDDDGFLRGICVSKLDVQVDKDEREEKERSGIGTPDPVDSFVDRGFIALSNRAEELFCRELEDADVSALWRIYGDLQLPLDVCVYLVEYCAAEKDDHPERIRPSYYEKVALNWKKNDVRTEKDAREYVEKGSIGMRILRSLGVRDRYLPVEAENRLIDEWRNKYHFSDEMMLLASERAVLHKPGTAGFGYMAGILESWYKKGIKTPEDVERETPKGTASINKSPQNDFMKRDGSGDISYIEDLAIRKMQED